MNEQYKSKKQMMKYEGGGKKSEKGKAMSKKDYSSKRKAC
jgi:hypothetical protein